MNCPICQNEEIKEGQNFCQICGFDLRKGPSVLTEEEIEENRMSENVLDESVQMQKRFAEFYNTAGLIGIGACGGVQLSEPAFRATFQEYKSEPRNSSEYPVELYVLRNGIKIFTICDRP